MRASGSAVTVENAPVHALHSERLRTGARTASELDRQRVTAFSRRHLAEFVPDLLTAGSFRAVGLAFATTGAALQRSGAMPEPVAGYTRKYRLGWGFAFRERARA